MPGPDVVVCSFHTPDEYYTAHADRLRATLERLGIAHVISTVEKAPDQDWADICRKKVAFLADACDAHPEARVFWIDVDCSLLSLPDYVTRSTADLVGFQRGFGSPLGIGYGQRTRFWEPCFFGIGATAGGRAFVRTARTLEADATLKATDDYFFEESWRANARDLTFQLLPSTAALHRVDPADPSPVPPFFSFGSSGKVAEFKDKVVQHGGITDDRVPLSRRLRGTGLRAAKRVERALPVPLAGRIRRAADGAGLTQALTGGDLDNGRLASAGITSPHRQRLVTAMVMAGQRGDADAVDSAFGRLSTMGAPNGAEISARRAADAFLAYARSDHDPADGGPSGHPVTLAWWVRPFPGNFGDWLSPLLVQHVSGAPVRYQSLTSASRSSHLVAVGSVGRFIKPSSVVVGTGISDTDVELDPRASYHGLRGPITAQVLRSGGGPAIDCFGDPGVLLRRALPITRESTNGRFALIRHFTHVGMPLQLPEDVDELDVLVSHPARIRGLLDQLAAYDGVITSAMHVMIAAHSYGIPCALVTFEGLESAVHGSGIKYRDYALGAEVGCHEPVVVPADLRRTDLRAMLHLERTPEHVLDRVEQALRAAVADDRLAARAPAPDAVGV